MSGKLPKRALRVSYLNWRGKRAIRTIVLRKIEFKRTEYYPEEQWIMTVYDYDRKAEREYAMKNISGWNYEK